MSTNERAVILATSPFSSVLFWGIFAAEHPDLKATQGGKPGPSDDSLA
jgi:hypothetical protein